jgi:NADH dehydrogenase
MAITKEDIRRLLAADDDAKLVLVEGLAEIVAAASGDGLEVISRADLRSRFGDAEPSERELADQAAALQTAVSELGG